MVQWLHWPSVFHIFGSLGVLWYFVWEWKAASAPAEDDRCSQAEKDLLAKNTLERVRWPCLSESSSLPADQLLRMRLR